MYGMYSPFNQQYVGMMGYGGGYPSYGGYGGYGGSMGGYGGGMGGLWGGYDPYGGQGGYGGGYGYNQMPWNGYMGYQPQQQYGGFFDQFDTRMNDLFKQYFSPKDAAASPGGGSGDTTPPAGGTNDTAAPAGDTPVAKPNVDYKYGDNFGKHYDATGKLGKKGEKQVQAAGYKDQADYFANDPTGQAAAQRYAQANTGANFGNSYATTGQFGDQGLGQIKAMGYKDQADYLANNENGKKQAAAYSQSSELKKKNIKT